MTGTDNIPGGDAWLAARRTLLAREKQLTHQREEIAALRRALPRRKLPRYEFEGQAGKTTLADLFDGRGQLLVYHFMFDPDWGAGCPSCSFWADHFEPMIPHLRQRDTAFAVVSSAPFAKLRAYAERMGWRFPWVSAAGTTFNSDFAVTFTEDQVESKAPLYNHGTVAPRSLEMPGASAFIREGDDVLHTYSTYTRGLDILNPTYHWLDLTAKGRDEDGLPYAQAWVKRHDEYA